MPDPLILGLETSTLAGSIAVARGAAILAKQVGRPDVSHSNTLLTDIDEILSGCDLSVQDIDLFAVANGPGSFTGLRIGIATVKALANTLNRPCVGIPTLEAIAHSGGVSAAIVPLLPAGRGEVFVQMFSTSSGAPNAVDHAQHLSPDRAVSRYTGQPRIVWAGDGAQLYASLIKEHATKAGYRFGCAESEDLDSLPDGWIIAAPGANLAEHVAQLAAARVNDGLGESANNLKAIYVRPSDAEMKL